MDTKLRSFSRSQLTKFMAFFLTVLFITAGVAEMQYLSYQNINPDILFVDDYKSSNDFLYRDVSDAMNEISSLFGGDVKLPRDLNYSYYITDGKETFKNAEPEAIQQSKTPVFIYENGQWNSVDNSSLSRPDYYLPEGYTLYLTFSQEYIEAQQQNLISERAVLLPGAVFIAACIILSLLFILYLIVVTGKSYNDDEIHLTRFDSIYTEIQIAGFITALALWFEMIVYYSNVITGTDLASGQIMSMILVGGMTAAVTIVCGILLLSMVRKIKAGRLIKQSFIYSICHKISYFIKSFFDDSRFGRYPLTKSLYRRQFTFIVASAGMVFLTAMLLATAYPLAIFPPVLEMVIVYWYFTENNKTYKEIDKGFNESLEEQMKSERMKIDLVTNVSHDLKTPLTSIISYVNLLSKEELSETARDYVNILADKSDRLKNIVSDLFDLAKSTSGNMSVDMESIDLKKLIEQTLADMEDDTEKSGLHIKAKLPESPVHITSDGKKLYRVFQNVIGNALKYSLTGTRVYIDMVIEGNRVNIIIKNTASYEMDFTADDILQRFNRGDKARTTEGSGLGLSIAESFTNVCGGNFKVDVDGDLFKVTVSFKVDIL